MSGGIVIRDDQSREQSGCCFYSWLAIVILIVFVVIRGEQMSKDKDRVQLGDRARDKVSGFTGIITGRYTYLNGCVRLSVQSPADKDGKLPDAMVFDEHQLEVVDKNVVPPKFPEDNSASAVPASETAKKERTGGPRDNVDTTRRNRE